MNGTKLISAGKVSTRIVFAFMALALVFLNSSTGSAQTANTGAITGTIQDSTGAVIPNATVTLSNAAGLLRTQTTDQSGNYSFTLLPVGQYKVVIAANGFQALQVPSVSVDVTETRLLNEKLAIGSQTEQVVVQASVVTTQTDSATLGTVVGQQTIQSLPLVTRNYTQILSLAPGVITDVYNAASVGRGSLDPIVNGNSNISNDIQLDGLSIVSFATGQASNLEGFYGDVPVPSPDAIQEFKIQTSNVDAGYGRKSGGNINVITKSGSNAFHGTLFEYLRNDVFNANGFFQKRQGLKRGELKQNQFGGTFGGPFIHDKAFFFVSYQGTRQVNGVNSLGFQTASLPSQLTADRSPATLGREFCPANNPIGSPGAQYAYTYNPSGALNPATDQIACDGSNINPVALKLLTVAIPTGQLAIPTPQSIQNGGSAAAVGTYSASIPAFFKEDQFLGNVDYVLSPKQTVYLRYYWDYGSEDRPFNCTGCLPGSGARNLSGNHVATGKLTSLLTDHLVNDARISYYYIRSSINSTDPFTNTQLGIKGIAQGAWIDVPPVITITGLVNFGGSTVDGAKSPQQNFSWSDQISWAHGKQNLRFGYESMPLIWNIKDYYQNRGSLTIQTWADFLLGKSAAANGTTLSNIFTSGGSQTPVGGTYNAYRQWAHSLFAQDDIKLSPRLTVNLGVRWEYNGYAWDGNGQLFNSWWTLAKQVPIPPVTGTFAGYTVANNYPGTPPDGIFRRPTRVAAGSTPWRDFGPRAGFAWQPFDSTGRLVVRGGGGAFFNQVQGNPMINIVSGNPPEAAPEGFTNTANAAATFQNPWTANRSLGFSTFMRTPTSALSTGSNDQFLVTPTILAADLNIQYQPKPLWVVEMSYVFNRGERLFVASQYSVPALASPTNPVNCGLTTGCVTTNTAANTSLRVPVVGYVAGGFSVDGNFGDSTYHGLQASLKRVMSHGLQGQASYTFGRTMTDITGVELHGTGGSVNSNDPLDRRQQRGEAEYDRPQRLVVNFSYQTPTIHHGDAFISHALSQWDFSGVITYQTGQPLTLTDTRGGAVYGFAGASRAQFCPGATKNDLKVSGGAESKLNSFFNSKALADTSANTGSTTCVMPVVGAVNGVGGATGYGNTSRATVRGPDQANWDLSVAKGVKLERYGNVNFRAQFFNAFNHAQFANPGVQANANTFGVINSTSVAARIIQFGLRYEF
jgi:Carboxypeptidase regulatory-like domain